jgi:hypothetical protein
MRWPIVRRSCLRCGDASGTNPNRCAGSRASHRTSLAHYDPIQSALARSSNSSSNADAPTRTGADHLKHNDAAHAEDRTGSNGFEHGRACLLIRGSHRREPLPTESARQPTTACDICGGDRLPARLPPTCLGVKCRMLDPARQANRPSSRPTQAAPHEEDAPGRRGVLLVLSARGELRGLASIPSRIHPLYENRALARIRPSRIASADERPCRTRR